MEGAGEGLFPCVDSYMVHQLVFGFKGLTVPWTVFPEANVFGLFWSANMLHRDMGDKFIHGPKSPGTGLFPDPLLAVTPLAHQLVVGILPGAPEEGVASSSPLHSHVQRFVETQKLGDKLLAVAPRAADRLAVGVSPRENIAGKSQHYLAAVITSSVAGAVGLIVVCGEKSVASAIPIAGKVTIPSSRAMLVRSWCQLICDRWHAWS